MSNVFNVDGTQREDVNVNNFIYEMKSQLPIIIEMAKIKSEYQRERFISLKRQGFTEEQAIEIIKEEKTPLDQ